MCSGGVRGGHTPIACPGRGLARGEMRVIHPYLSQELRARWGAVGCKIREGFLEEEVAYDACTPFNGERRETRPRERPDGWVQ